MPADLEDALKGYLHPHEKLEDAIMEVFIIAVDFRWVILTNERIIVGIKRILGSFDFKDLVIKSLDIDLDLGYIYDKIEFKIPGKAYNGHFYTFRRKDTLKFFKKVEKRIIELEEGKEIVPQKQKQDGGKNHYYERLNKLNKMVKKGLITQEEYEIKKKKILEEI